MSYDLFFRGRSPGQSLSREDFSGYFDGRRLYELSESQAWYSNEDTGVYFAFEHSEPAESSDLEDEADASLLPVSFNLNYVRPHVFGLEAEPELAAFIARFDLTVSDPQNSGMGDGEYTKEGFLRGWNAGNEFGYRAILSQEPTQSLLTLPASKIEAYWRWNYRREIRQEEIEEDVFVPRVFFFDVNGKVNTGVAWGDGIPILLPVVDFALAPRDRLAPRRLFRSKKDIVMIAWEELEAIIRRFSQVPGDPACYELFYADTPSDIERLIRQKQPPREMPQGVAFDQILDQELVDKVRATAAKDEDDTAGSRG